MALVSISKAILLSGTSRPTFYRKHLGDKAKPEDRVSVQVVDGHKKIDTSELLRVFKVLHETDSRTVTDETPVQINTADKNIPVNNDSELVSLRQQLKEAKERESWYQSQISEEKARAERAEVKLLAHLEPTITSDSVQEEIAGLKEELRQLSARKWWEWWK